MDNEPSNHITLVCLNTNFWLIEFVLHMKSFFLTTSDNYPKPLDLINLSTNSFTKKLPEHNYWLSTLHLIKRDNSVDLILVSNLKLKSHVVIK